MFQIVDSNPWRIPTLIGEWVRLAIIKETTGKFREFWFFVNIETQQRYIEEQSSIGLKRIDDDLAKELEQLVTAAGLNKLITKCP